MSLKSTEKPAALLEAMKTAIMIWEEMRRRPTSATSVSWITQAVRARRSRRRRCSSSLPQWRITSWKRRMCKRRQGRNMTRPAPNTALQATQMRWSCTRLCRMPSSSTRTRWTEQSMWLHSRIRAVSGHAAIRSLQKTSMAVSTRIPTRTVRCRSRPEVIPSRCRRRRAE